MKKKKVNEIFYSVIGEGWNAGTPAVFVRFCRCNLKCPFCETSFESGAIMTDIEIVNTVVRESQSRCQTVVLTGGEPGLWIDKPLIDMLHSALMTVIVETNGTIDNPAFELADFVTCSPKFEYCENADVKVGRIDELKVIYDGGVGAMGVYERIARERSVSKGHLFLVPCDMKAPEENEELTQAAAQYVMRHPEWRLGLRANIKKNNKHYG